LLFCVEQVDHIVPLFHLGTNNYSNLVLCCKECNESKGAKLGCKKPDWIKANSYQMSYRERRRIEDLLGERFE
jgi:5-methylcytosine-specific restriction endonuclease McrA